MNCFSLTSFHFRIFYNFNFERNIRFNSYFAFSFRTIFVFSRSWFNSFDLSFNLASFFVKCACNNNLTWFSIRFFNNLSILKVWLVSVCLTLWNWFFLNNWLDTNFYNSINWVFCFFLGYKFLLVLIVRSSYSNFSIFAWCYLFFLAHFYTFIIDVFCIKWFFYFFYNWLNTNLDDLINRIFSCLKFAFFSFGNLTIFDYKSICSFLFTWCSTSFFSLASFKIWIILYSSLERKFFLFSYFVSTVVCTFTN